MSEEIKERLEKLRREYRPSMAGDVCLSWAADVAPALSEALALITSLTAELTAARAEVERLRGGTGMSRVRIVIKRQDYGMAANIGGDVVKSVVTVDVDSEALTTALAPGPHGYAEVIGAELLKDDPS